MCQVSVSKSSLSAKELKTFFGKHDEKMWAKRERI
jgi:hypothetical protein